MNFTLQRTRRLSIIVGAAALVMEHFENEQLTNHLKQLSMDKTQ